MVNTTPSRPRCPVTIRRPPVLSRLLLFWLLLGLVAVVVWVWHPRWGQALLCGVAVSALPGASFAWQGLRRLGGARQSGAMVHAVYRAETHRFLLTAMLFIAVFSQMKELHLAAFFIAFIGTHIGSSVVTARVLAQFRR